MKRFAIIGTGRISDWVLKGAVQDPRFKAVAVCSRSLERARNFIASHPEAFLADASAYDNLDEMLKQESIDAVYIGTPNNTHHEYTLRCLKAGKNVLCEKPLACSLQEAKEMVEASRNSGKALMEAMISTLNPNFIAARQLLGEIGPIKHYSSTYCQYSTKYDALKEGIVANSFSPASGGGALPDIGVYTTFPLVAMFGLPEDLKASHVIVNTPEGPIEVQGSACLQYRDMTANLTYSKAADSTQRTEICGEKGTISLDEIHICREASLILRGAPSSGRGTRNERQIISQSLDNDEYYYEFKEFIDIMEEGRTESLVNSHKVSLDNLALMDMIRKTI